MVSMNAAVAGQWGEESWGSLTWESLPVNVPIPALYAVGVLILSVTIFRKYKK